MNKETSLRAYEEKLKVDRIVTEVGHLKDTLKKMQEEKIRYKAHRLSRDGHIAQLERAIQKTEREKKWNSQMWNYAKLNGATGEIVCFLYPDIDCETPSAFPVWKYMKLTNLNSVDDCLLGIASKLCDASKGLLTSFIITAVRPIGE